MLQQRAAASIYVCKLTAKATSNSATVVQAHLQSDSPKHTVRHHRPKTCFALMHSISNVALSFVLPRRQLLLRCKSSCGALPTVQAAHVTADCEHTYADPATNNGSLQPPLQQLL
jgi:hypothetical protein